MGPPGCSSTRPEAAARAHIACSANLALESASDLGEAQSAKTELPGSPGLQTRRFGGFCYFRFWVSASRNEGRTRGGFRAQRAALLNTSLTASLRPVIRKSIVSSQSGELLLPRLALGKTD